MNVVTLNPELLEISKRQKEMDVLNCEVFWQNHDVYVVKAAQVILPPFFYPIYQWQDFYAFSPLPLLLKKGHLTIGYRGEDYLQRTKGDVTPPEMFIDPDIRRIGGSPMLTREHRDPQAFTEMMAVAMQADIYEVESRNPGKTNIILCGGKDSLNLLLLVWKNPTIVYSAAPNFQLVRQFVVDNQLDFEVRELLDQSDNTLLSREIIEAFGMVNLANWRWASHLRQIARMLDHQAVFWKGQFADAVLTDYWRSYTSGFSKPRKTLKKVYKRMARLLPSILTAIPDHITLLDFRRSIWERGAVMQGAHMGALRSITDCLIVSAYHGPRTSQTWLAADLPMLTQIDLRPAIGRILAGREVTYPAENPAPPPSSSRQNLRSVEALVSACDDFGIPVRR